MSHAAHLARLERARLLKIERQAKSRQEAREVAEGVAETVVLSRARGAAIDDPPAAAGGRRGAYRRAPGLDWLARRGRLTQAQKAAGERYGACYRRALGPPSLGSTLDVKPGLGGGGPPLTAVVAQAEANLRAAEALARLRRQLQGQADLIAACDTVCGQELTPREAAASDREAYVLEGVLRVALDLLSAEAAPASLRSGG
ncbi:MAG: hypothetical protein ACK41C_12730 [Phenylobacterium sp.]|uniref:hypothetical protein n=1 Tax=Phenylobacterium sp. TaxID=1871053 RepID=UPI00391B7855